LICSFPPSIGFDRIPDGPDKGAYVRKEHFIKGRLDLLAKIRRTKLKGHPGSKSSSSQPEAVTATTSTSSIMVIMTQHDDIDEISQGQLPSTSSQDLDLLIRNLQYHDVPYKTSQLLGDNEDPDSFIDVEEGDKLFDFLALGETFVSGPSPSLEVGDDDSWLLDALEEDLSEAPITYLDSTSSGMKKPPLIDWLVQSKMNARKQTNDDDIVTRSSHGVVRQPSVVSSNSSVDASSSDDVISSSSSLSSMKTASLDDDCKKRNSLHISQFQ
jgi:hypothetical protein